MKKCLFIKKTISVLTALVLILCMQCTNAVLVSAETVYPLVLAKLDGTEYNMVHPGLNSSSQTKVIDRRLNFTPRDTETPNADTTVFSNVYISTTGAGVGTFDISGADVLTFTATIGDNGAWEEYKDYISIRLRSNSVNYYIPAEDVAAGFADVVPGETQKLKFSLDGLDKTLLTAVKEVEFSVSGSTSDLDLYLNISNIMAEVVTDVVEVAKLNGTEWPIVHPGLNSDYHAMNLDRYLNFTPRNTESPTPDSTVYNVVTTSRTSVGLSTVDLSLCDVFTFNLTVEDNGAWDEYKDYIVIALNDVSFSTAAVNKALAAVVPGTESKITFDLTDIDRSLLTAVNGCTISFKDTGSSDLDLHIMINTMQGEVWYDDVIILDDEAGESRYPAYSNSEDGIAKVGTHSLKANTLANEGWIAYAGFWGGAALEAKDISKVTNNGTIGALRFWVYVEDITSLDDVKALQASGSYSIIKLGDCNSPDGTYFGWNTWINQVTDSGWNEVILKFADAYIESGTPDTTAIDTLYMKLSQGSPSKTLYLDDIRVSADTAPTFIGDYEDIPEDLLFAKLNGTEWPICHPGLSGQFNTPDYDAMHFDRRFSFTPEGDVRNLAYIKRTAVSGMEALDLSKYNTFTFELLVEDNGAWEDYKDSLIFSLTTSGASYTVSDKALKQALSTVVPGEKCEVVISLASIGRKSLSSIYGFRIELGEGSSDKILHLTITNAIVKYNKDYPEVIDDRSRPDVSTSDSVYLIDALGIRDTLGESEDDTYASLESRFTRNASVDDVIFNGDLSSAELISFKLYIGNVAALPSDLFITFGITDDEEIKYLNAVDITEQITENGWNTVSISTADIAENAADLASISCWKLSTTDTASLGEYYNVRLYICNIVGVKLDVTPSITVGNNETEMYITWFTTSNAEGKAVLIENGVETEFEAFEHSASQAEYYYYNRAKITGLKPNTDYTYRVGAEGAWSEEYPLSTKDFDNSFSFIQVSDVQFNGSSSMVTNWKTTLSRINEYFPDTSFILNTGDVSDISGRNDLYLLYKSPELLKSYITGVVPGNHDNTKNGYYNEHFASPATYEAYSGCGANECDYWYSYNSVLFISLNTNIKDNAYHEAFVRKVIEEQGDNFDWKIVNCHHSLFSASYHSLESDVISFRDNLSPVFSELGIDMVLSGHDHCYDRSYIMNGSTPVISDKVFASNTNGGVLYISATTASASKFNGPVDGCEEYSAKIVESTYGFINFDVRESFIKLTYYSSADMTVLDEFTIYKAAGATAEDLVILKKAVLSGVTDGMVDYNEDGIINIRDIISLKKRLANAA